MEDVEVFAVCAAHHLDRGSLRDTQGLQLGGKADTIAYALRHLSHGLACFPQTLRADFARTAGRTAQCVTRGDRPERGLSAWRTGWSQLRYHNGDAAGVLQGGLAGLA
eukprot:4055891-Pyramimonas_sp.AAC.1